MGITPKELVNQETAEAYRKAAEYLRRGRDLYARAVGALEQEADRLDPPKPKPGFIVFENGTRGLIVDKDFAPNYGFEYDVVTEKGERLYLDDVIEWEYVDD